MGATSIERDALKDPRPGDVWESQVMRDQLHVHAVKGGVVYCGKWSKDEVSMGCVKGSLEQFERDCLTAGARLIQRHEDCPAEILASLPFATGSAEVPRG